MMQAWKPAAGGRQRSLPAHPVVMGGVAGSQARTESPHNGGGSVFELLGVHAPPVVGGDDAVSENGGAAPAQVAGSGAQGVLLESMTEPHGLELQVLPVVPNTSTLMGAHCSPVGGLHVQPHWAGWALSAPLPSYASM
jgi:hypothetical protein